MRSTSLRRERPDDQLQGVKQNSGEKDDLLHKGRDDIIDGDIEFGADRAHPAQHCEDRCEEENLSPGRVKPQGSTAT